MATRRSTPNVFGLSFLDVICCGFGAALLLFILVNTRDASIARSLESKVVESDRVLQETRANASIRATIASIAERSRAGSGAAAIEDPAWTEVRSALLLLDTSGSMSRYLPDEPAFAEAPAWQREAGVKWRDTEHVIAELLLAIPSLERFAIVAIGDRLDGRVPGVPLYPPNASPDKAWSWSTADEASVVAALAVLRTTKPAGGSNHHASLEAVMASPTYRDDPPDTIVIVMDGLPNHGPVGDAPIDDRVDPTDGVVLRASRAERAVQVRNLLEQRRRADAEQGAMSPTIHCVLLPWPDDPDLFGFALAMSGPTGGRVISLTPAERGGGK